LTVSGRRTTGRLAVLLLRGLLHLLLRLLHLRRLRHELRATEALLLRRALRSLPLREAGLAGVRGSSGRIAGRLIHSCSLLLVFVRVCGRAYPKAAAREP
jgi:hypothetical protein